MSEAIQLELNIENKTPEEIRLSLMQKQIDQMNESMGKVRRKLFAEMGEMKKTYSQVQKENEELKSILRDLTKQKVEWMYSQNGFLFESHEPKIVNLA